MYGRRLRQVQKQLVGLEGNAAVAAAVAAEGDVRAAIEMLPAAADTDTDTDTAAVNLPAAPVATAAEGAGAGASEEEERMAHPDELTPDESEELLVATGGDDSNGGNGPGDDGERLSDPWEV